MIPHDLPGTVTVLSLRGNREGLSLAADQIDLNLI